VLNLAKALGLEIEIKGTQEEVEGPEKKKTRPVKKLPKVLKNGDMDKLFESFKLHRFADLRDRCAMQVMYASALRISEVCNLTKDDVDLEGGYLTLQQAKGHKDRVVAMDDDTIAWLRKWEAARPQQAVYYFCTKKGTQMSVRQLRDKVYQISDRAGIYIRDGAEKKRVHPHTLRHTGLTDMLDQNFNLREIQEQAGHKSIKTTSIYLSVRPEQLRKKMKNRNNGMAQEKGE